LAKARPNSEKQFWNETLGYYQYNETIPFLMADAMVGQRCAEVFGPAYQRNLGVDDGSS
jgi:hypothetical protein